MSSDYKLSLPTAVLININIMLGAGMFMNTALLANRAGAVGSVGYLIIGALLLPLILSITTLSSLHPTGGFYGYASREIHPFAGFICAWSYFTAKLASASFIIHASMSLLQQLVPALTNYNIFVLDGSCLILFALLNMLNLRSGSIIQFVFMGLKIVPIICVLVAALFLFKTGNLAPAQQLWEGVPSIIPLVLYAMVGFESATAISAKIENPEKNTARVILISYAIAILITFIYQTCFYGMLGSALQNMTDFREPFPLLLDMLWPSRGHAQQYITSFLHIAIAASALGGSYGILFSNNWNLYMLAEHNHLFFSAAFRRLNRHGIAWLCVIAEAALCAFYFWVSKGSQLPLQQTSAFGMVIAYGMSVVALLCAQKNRRALHLPWFVPVLAIGSCAILMVACVRGLMHHGIYSLTAFGALLAAGIFMFVCTRRSNAV